MEFSSWMDLFLENPHKPFQKCAFVPDSGSFILERRGAFGSWAVQARSLPSLDPWTCTLGQLKWRFTHLLSTIFQLHGVLLTTLRGRDQGAHPLRRTVMPKVIYLSQDSRTTH